MKSQWNRGAVIFFALLLVPLILVLTHGEDKKTPVPQQSGDTNAKSNAKYAGTPLPFTIQSAAINPNFKDNLKLVQIDVSVVGGSADDWAATAIVIAEKVATNDVNAAVVTVKRADLGGIDAQNMYREYAKVYFNPDLTRAIWPDEKWAIFRADHVATLTEIQYVNEFNALNQNLIDKGMDYDRADKKAGAVIAKKYGLPKDWAIPLGNLGGKPVLRTDFAIGDSTAISQSLKVLKQTLGS